MTKTILMITYNYPPLTISSGIQRSLAFSRFLPENGWQPIVLTPSSGAYANKSDSGEKLIPEKVIRESSFALDSSRHLAPFGKYPEFMALPDRWWTWRLSAVKKGLELIKKYKPDVIWSTFPISTTHWIASILKRKTGIPWVADFRDPMTKEGYPVERLTRAVRKSIEKRTVNLADVVTFTAPSSVKLYSQCYPHLSQSKWQIIYNGYDEDNFSIALNIAQSQTEKANLSDQRPKTLLHSGTLYPLERNPESFFQAIKELKEGGVFTPQRIKIVLRATNNDELYKRRIADGDIVDLVDILPPVKYEDALAEMVCADGLLVLQAAICNHQIPAKIYEYFRAQKPILALTDRDGDTAFILKKGGIENIADITSVAEIKRLLTEFVNGETATVMPSETSYLEFSRKNQTVEFARLLNELTANG
ncbi:MAG: glycosyltransferase [Gammaproteobacteria bacterium]|nr:MAG: glycosyltransferase [Gammaproteobacteria bacterium]